jgi:uncharacterized phage protein (TIGR01671 family)
MNMRNIKFRAWEKNLKEIIPVNNIDFASRMINTGSAWRLFDEIELMQYTGLNDKNGNKIYEGDIVRREFEIGRIIIDPLSLGAEDYEIEDSGYFIGVVCLRPSEGYVLNKCKKFNDEDELQAKKSGVKLYANRAVVIGNIYENPELLEGAKNE